MKALSFSILFFYPIFLTSQIFIQPIIGYDFTEMRNTKTINPDDLFPYFRNYIFNEGYDLKSTLVGVEIEKQFSKKIRVVLNSEFTIKRARAFNMNIISIDGFKFNYFKNSISVKYFPLKFLFFEAGGNLNFLTRFRNVYKEKEYSVFSSFSKDLGVTTSTGINYKNTELKFYYHNGFNRHDSSGLDIKPLRGFGLSAGYKFKMKK